MPMLLMWNVWNCIQWLETDFWMSGILACKAVQILHLLRWRKWNWVMKLLKGWKSQVWPLTFLYYDIKSLSWIVLYCIMQWRHLLKCQDSFLGNQVWNSFCLNDSAKILWKYSLDTSMLRVGEMRTPQWNNSVIQWFHWEFRVLLPWTPFVEIVVNDLLINLFMLVKPLCQNESEEASDISVEWLSLHSW